MAGKRSEVREGMRIDRDVAIVMDDGLTLRADSRGSESLIARHPGVV